MKQNSPIFLTIDPPFFADFGKKIRSFNLLAKSGVPLGRHAPRKAAFDAYHPED
jgi:hypothetical protein